MVSLEFAQELSKVSAELGTRMDTRAGAGDEYAGPLGGNGTGTFGGAVNNRFVADLVSNDNCNNFSQR